MEFCELYSLYILPSNRYYAVVIKNITIPYLQFSLCRLCDDEHEGKMVVVELLLQFYNESNYQRVFTD